MSVIIDAVQEGSPAHKAKILAGETLVSIDDNEIIDVLDYRFYQNNKKLSLLLIDKNGKQKKIKIKKDEYEELGLLFSSYLMDSKRSCRNKCIFCFIDQLPKGLRDSLYFKDDDSRLSFLFGNYITLTNITEHEIERIIRMHISPINISVHTTNPELRVKMMNNKNAGNALSILNRFNDAGIKMNSQLVLCPDINDKDELRRSLDDLTSLENMECIAAVPVGITKYREGLAHIRPFEKTDALETLDIIDEYAMKCIEKYGERRVYASDEFYLIAEKEIPDSEFYGDFLQLENGVGLWSLLLSEAKDAICDVEPFGEQRHISIATGVAAAPLIRKIVSMCEEKLMGLRCDVFAIKNKFFGEKITVAGLVTATDIYEQLNGKELGSKLLIPSCMLRNEGDMFLDSITVEELSDRLGVDIEPVDNDGYALVDTILTD
ncbi:MAG: DUF512 domain-containing protein [Acutalibacteraceae bacterium]|nr:DUF512 domain-containing protein [Acutalibacteraceae bacterium]